LTLDKLIKKLLRWNDLLLFKFHNENDLLLFKFHNDFTDIYLQLVEIPYYHFTKHIRENKIWSQKSYANLKVIKPLISLKSEKLAGIVIYQKVEYERNHLSRQ